jgi:IS5 family transposase
MSKQMTLGTGFERYSKTNRREKFLAEMDRIVPWADLCALIAPVYPKAGDGRPPKELARASNGPRMLGDIPDARRPESQEP